METARSYVYRHDVHVERRTRHVTSIVVETRDGCQLYVQNLVLVVL